MAETGRGERGRGHGGRLIGPVASGVWETTPADKAEPRSVGKEQHQSAAGDNFNAMLHGGLPGSNTVDSRSDQGVQCDARQ